MKVCLAGISSFIHDLIVNHSELSLLNLSRPQHGRTEIPPQHDRKEISLDRPRHGTAANNPPPASEASGGVNSEMLLVLN